MDGGFAGSLEFIRACKVLEPRQTLTNVCIKRTVQAILANLGLRKFFPSVDPSAETSHNPRSSSPVVPFHILIAGRCQARYGGHHSETAAKACLVTFQKRALTILQHAAPTGACLCCTKDASNHIPPTEGLNFEAQPRLSSGLILPVQPAAIGQADRWGQAMHPPVWFPAPAYQGSRLWGRGKGEGGRGRGTGWILGSANTI
jgi:hypothetical protein